jgi:hypothetical protein
MGKMDIWYAHLDEEELLQGIRSAAKAATSKKNAKAAKRFEKSAEKAAAKARTRDSLQALSKLGEVVDGKYRIVSQPPIVVPVRELAATYGLSADEVERGIHEQFRAYRATLRTISVSCWSGSSWSMWPARWSGWAASAPGPSSPCSRAATSTTRCSCRSRRRPGRCWRVIWWPV